MQTRPLTPAALIVRALAGIALLAIAAWIGYPQQKGSPGSQQGSPKSTSGNNLTKESPPTGDSKTGERPNPLIMKGLTLKDQDGETIYQGDIDLAPTLARIKKGEKFPHRNDGASFGNRERRLPQKPPGYYKEYVVPTPDLRGPGPQRLVIGDKGEVYYTSNHYLSFKRVTVPLELLPGPEGSSGK
jgi:ribonuclease T1